MVLQLRELARDGCCAGRAGKLKICGVIPVRLGSSRFPGKGLAKLEGKELILHTLDGARQYSNFERLIVATDNHTIEELVTAHGGEVFYSEKPFRNGSERCAAAIANIDCDICVNVQGDEVFVNGVIIDRTVRVLEENLELPVATAVFSIADPNEIADHNLVKVALDENDRAIRFSRQPITGDSGATLVNYGHVGIYAYRKDFLAMYAVLSPTAGEITESLEQLRILESGFPIGAARLDTSVVSINTPEDLLAASKILSQERGVR
jgi:3-deoxy-manno-octulosonate cytidylyltransferase (CMP-KDO synthetase)